MSGTRHSRGSNKFPRLRCLRSEARKEELRPVLLRRRHVVGFEEGVASAPMSAVRLWQLALHGLFLCAPPPSEDPNISPFQTSPLTTRVQMKTGPNEK